MDKIRDHISAVKTLIEDPSLHPQHSIAYTNKMIYYSLLMAKDSVFFQLRNTPGLKNKPEFTTYFIPCVEMEEVDVNECPCEENVGCTWMRSKQFLPPFKGNKLDVIKPLDIENTESYAFVEWDGIIDLKRSRKPERLNNKYSIRNISGNKRLYLHIFKKAKPRMLSLSAPFNDPKDVINLILNGCSTNKMMCGFMDTNLDISGPHKESILRTAVTMLKQLEDKNIIPDRRTDDIDGSKFIQNPGRN